MKVIAHFLATQGMVQAVNLSCGILILRILPIPDFAIYVLLGALHNVGSFCADMGLSQAINTLGAKDRGRIGAILGSALSIRRRLLAFALVATAAVAFVLFRNTLDSAWLGAAGLVMVCVAAWIHQTLNMYASVLNVHHDSDSLFKSGIAVGLTRLALIVAILPAFPNPLVAFAINLVGSAAGLGVGTRLIARRVHGAVEAAKAEAGRIVDFIRPLWPGAIYFLVQGQIATVLLSIQGQVANLAEVGALSRLGQILALLAMLNAFWVQPTFARISSRGEFRRRAAALVAGIVAASVLLVATTFAWPGAWLLILGAQYSALSAELPFAVGFALVSVIGATLFTLVMATGDTRKQYIQIPLGIGVQCLVIFGWGVDSTLDALILSGAAQVTYTLLQAVLLAMSLLRPEPAARTEAKLPPT